ncbi:hypothetical protein DHW03_05145 [Pedobacter yonginense]|uniref:phosphoglycolate phosphatase n=1 Tax=Pedobacter yonginense TaxID=651869 RepID=A0A317EQP3_9SPHI|nr:HAD-IA family hydrolase [Pedobacter yonginense]PWS29210.1 hypothetical protein DHW03_05145 [Pedobacter yonginense]
MMTENSIDWRKIKLVIFDVDGTLYDQSKLRWRMLFALLGYYFFRPWRYKDFLILHHFRAEREKKAGFFGDNLNQLQYEWCKEQVNLPLSRIKKVVDKWIFDYPNQYLASCKYPDLDFFFQSLRNQHIRIAVYSDYDAELKLKAMNLNVDLSVASTDQSVNAMKPLPNGLIKILTKFSIEDKNSCLFIGDRVELDGECAKRAGVPYLIITKQQAKINLYKSLSNNLLNES